MTRTPFASSTPTSFSSRPGNSAVTLTSLSVSLTSMSGHPSVRSNRRSEPNGVTSKTAQDVIEHAIHFTVQRQQGICIFAALYRNVAATIPWDEISDSHGHFSFLVRFGKGQPPARPGRAGETQSRPIGL